MRSVDRCPTWQGSPLKKHESPWRTIYLPATLPIRQEPCALSQQRSKTIQKLSQSIKTRVIHRNSIFFWLKPAGTKSSVGLFIIVRRQNSLHSHFCLLAKRPAARTATTHLHRP
jgi:hypothetical protein